jgi:hypothetical protein
VVWWRSGGLVQTTLSGGFARRKPRLDAGFTQTIPDSDMLKTFLRVRCAWTFLLGDGIAVIVMQLTSGFHSLVTPYRRICTDPDASLPVLLGSGEDSSTGIAAVLIERGKYSKLELDAINVPSSTVASTHVSQHSHRLCVFYTVLVDDCGNHFSESLMLIPSRSSSPHHPSYNW